MCHRLLKENDPNPTRKICAPDKRKVEQAHTTQSPEGTTHFQQINAHPKLQTEAMQNRLKPATEVDASETTKFATTSVPSVRYRQIE